MIRFGSLLALVSAAVLAADIQPSGKFQVHEWGTFTSIAGPDGLALDWLPFGGPADLPCFVHRFEIGFKASLGGTVRMETPVIYFYSTQPLTARVRVAFPQGFITEWYPRAKQVATYLGSGPGPKNPDTRQARPGEQDSIEWPQIHMEPALASPRFPFEFEASHYYAARSTDAAPLTAQGEREKFLFYRGVGRFEPPVSVKTGAGDQVQVKNLAHDPLAGVMLFENRDGKIRYRVQGDVKNEAAMELPEFSAGLDQVKTGLENFLVAQGLFPKEAHAMVETWRDSWFEEGSRVFYILPLSAVDSILPLEVEPRPEQTVRVFVGRIEVLTPAVKETITTAIAKQDVMTLQKYGRFLEPITREMGPMSAAVRAVYAKYMTQEGACGATW